MQHIIRKRLTGWILATVLLSSSYLYIPVKVQAQELSLFAAAQATNSLKASVSKATLEKGDTKKITLTYGGSALTASKATWSTSKSSVATVSNGTITAKGKGKATITAKYSGKTVTIDITVDEDTGLLSKVSKVTLQKGKTSTLALTYDDKALAGSKATWTTSDSSVATVKDGVVTARAKGTATITAKYKNESVKIKVTVEGSKSSLESAETKITMIKGDKQSITLKYDGTKLAGSKADWSTSKSSVVTVSDGKLTAKGAGTATISATYKGETVKVEITVKEDEKKFAATETKITMIKGDKQTINLRYDGAKLAGTKADWSTSKSSVVTVSDGTLTAKGAGTATISATYKGETVKVEITVKEDEKKLTAIESKITMIKGDKQTINLKYDGAKLAGSKADWSTSKSSVVTVSDGTLTAKGAGTATISATYKGETVKVGITVKEEDVKKFAATETKITMIKGDKQTINLKYDGAKLAGSKADWSTSKSSVVTVSDGTLTAKVAGTATISATYKGETVKVEITVDEGNKLEVDDDSISIKEGKKETIKVTYNGKKVSGSDVKWSTSKSSVATVKDGVVTGKKTGKAIITAKYKGEEIEISVKVK